MGSEERGISKWAGYSIAYSLVGDYLEETGKSASEMTNIDSLHTVNGTVVSDYDVLALSSDFPEVWKKARHAYLDGSQAANLVRDKTAETFSAGGSIYRVISLYLKK